MCGVPYTALPMATLMSVEAGMPMVVRRKEAKDYGTKKMVEGVWKEGQGCLVVEDVVTTGSSVLETAALLREHGMIVTDCVVLLDREQGGRNRLEEEGVRVTSILSVSQVLKVLRESEKITEEMEASVSEFIVNNHTSNSFKPVKIPVSLGERMRMSPNKVTQKLFQIVLEKNIPLSVYIL